MVAKEKGAVLVTYTSITKCTNANKNEKHVTKYRLQKNGTIIVSCFGLLFIANLIVGVDSANAILMTPASRVQFPNILLKRGPAIHVQYTSYV